ncbi:MAG TPA: Uma2 family endonuclease [Bryobacteraceae bacterium]|nr:Uma2 family endonuclease [Bryobacteraceae bacterium]
MITVKQYISFKAPSGFRDELIDGEIVLSPDVKALHQEVAHRICWLLERKLEGSRFVTRQRTNMQMPQDHSMPSPDVFVIDAERWRAAIAQNGYPQQSPQLVVEVISRSNTKKHVNRKAALYLKNGASAVWIVYPNKKIIQVLSAANPAAALSIDDSLTLPPPLPAIHLRVRDIFDMSSLPG